MLQIKYLLIIGMIFLIGFVSSATYYVTDPNNCPSSDAVNFPGQNCAPEDICGDSSGTAQCYDTTTISAPGGDVTTTGSGGTNYGCSDMACDGGFVTNCYATADAGAPFCDNSGNFWCDRNSTCYNKNVQTTCKGGSFNSSTCSATCTTSHFACDGSTTDADGCEIHSYTSCGSGTGTIAHNECFDANNGNCTSTTRLDCNDDDSDGIEQTCNAGDGCEILIGGSCSVGSLSGTYASYCSGGDGVCTVDKSYFETGTLTEYQTNSSQNFLWGVDYTISTILNLSWSSGGGIHVNSTGIYFNNSKIVSGGGTDTNASTICSGDEALLGNSTCFNSSFWLDDTDTDTFNTTLEIETAINQSKYFDIQINYSNILNHPSMSDTDTWNTTTEMRNAVNDSTLNYAFNSNSSTYWNESIGTNTSQFNFITSLITLDLTWLGNWVWNHIDNSTFFKGSDTNASTICDGNEVLMGNATCFNSSLFASAGDTDTWNTTAEIQSAMNNSGDYNMSFQNVQFGASLDLDILLNLAGTRTVVSGNNFDGIKSAFTVNAIENKTTVSGYNSLVGAGSSSNNNFSSVSGMTGISLANSGILGTVPIRRLIGANVGAINQGADNVSEVIGLYIGTVGIAEKYGQQSLGKNWAIKDESNRATNFSTNMYIHSGNVTADWFLGKVNYSDIQNHPSMTDTDTFNTTAEILEAVNGSNMNHTGLTSYGNITMPQNNTLCLNLACSQWIKSNSSGVYIYGG